MVKTEQKRLNELWELALEFLYRDRRPDFAYKLLQHCLFNHPIDQAEKFLDSKLFTDPHPRAHRLAQRVRHSLLESDGLEMFQTSPLAKL